MKTPIADFVAHYARSAAARFHMPGHKGEALLGCEALDLTEIQGADDLYAADDIIAESERNAAALFGSAHTFYSTEGSTHAIKAMLALACGGKKAPRVLAARNAHKAFLYGCGLLGIDADWLYGEDDTHLCRCHVTPEALDKALNGAKNTYDAVFVTSPDYLGNMADIAALSRVCHAHGVPLLVDNAHGAYLAFTSPSRHPMALGADACADSAHKTLPVLTGGAYLHISQNAPAHFAKNARRALAIFGSSSPSYLTLQSLDLCNRTLAEGYPARVQEAAKRVEELRFSLENAGYTVMGDEPLKLTVSGLARGLTGNDLANALREAGAEVEFADTQLAVLMCTPHNSPADFVLAREVLTTLPARTPIDISHPVSALVADRACSIREALLGDSTRVAVRDAIGRICAAPTVSCPPAVPIVASGEIVQESALPLFAAYGIEEIDVLC